MIWKIELTIKSYLYSASRVHLLNVGNLFFNKAVGNTTDSKPHPQACCGE